MTNTTIPSERTTDPVTKAASPEVAPTSPSLSNAERQAAEELWTLLGGLPLALDQAAAFVQETGYSLEEYCILFHQAQSCARVC
jgi:hypothetical protein